jgi:hypothetical protein
VKIEREGYIVSPMDFAYRLEHLHWNPKPGEYGVQLAIADAEGARTAMGIIGLPADFARRLIEAAEKKQKVTLTLSVEEP